MKCSQCGHTLPRGSQFCLRCGAAAPGAQPSSYPTTMPGSAMGTAPGAIPARSSGPPKTLIALLVLLCAGLVAGIAAVTHSRGNLSNGTGANVNGNGIAVATAPNLPQRGLANANGPVMNGGGLANAAAPNVNGAGMANATAPSINGGGLANAHAPAVSGQGLANAPSAAPPASAQPMDDVMPYLRALAKIEAERQADQRAADAQLSGVQQRIEKDMIAMADPDSHPENDLKGIQDQMNNLIPTLSTEYVRLNTEVQDLERVPGVPPSCNQLQSDYLSVLAPFVTLGNQANLLANHVNQEAQANPLTGPTDANAQVGAQMSAFLSASQQESAGLVQSESDLQTVFRTHNIDPFFQILNTEGNAGGGMANLTIPAPHL